MGRSGTRQKINFVALCLLGATLLGQNLVQASEKSTGLSENEKLAQPIENTAETQPNGEIKFPDEHPLSYQEARATKKSNLEAQYGSGHLDVNIYSIQPEGGPITGETRVIVRGGPFKDMDLIYPHPKCRFGKMSKVVSATYVSCTEEPLTRYQIEGRHKNRQDICLQCDNSPEWEAPEIIPFSVSLTGDFTDSVDSEPFRYYAPTKVHAIYPRYGPRDGETFIQVWGANFLNFDEMTSCNIGSVSRPAYFVNEGYLTCRANSGEVVDKAIPFSVTLNDQQNSREKVDYWFYNAPTVAQLVPDYGPDAGGNTIVIKGNNFDPFKESSEWINNKNDTFCAFDQLGKMPLHVINSTRAECEVPPNVAGLDMTFVEITLNNQNYTDDMVPYYYYRPPKIYSVDPQQGPTSGMTEVNIFGDEFKKGKDIICIWGDIKTHAKWITDTHIKCVSPKVDHAGHVDLAITYQGDGSKFVSEAVDFLYYETPVADSISPKCGPTLGYTQIVVKGKNFVDMGFGMAKCMFNKTIAMNTTVVDENTLMCSTPPLTAYQSSLPPAQMFFNVDVSLNGHEMTNSGIEFRYYPEPIVQQVEEAQWGPVSGGTTSQLYGFGFKHPNVCNLQVRYGALVQTPTQHNDTWIETVSPRVNVPDRVVITASGNGQNFAGDKILHYRDDGSGSNWQGTNNNLYLRDDHVRFTYIQDVFVHSVHPQMGPTTGHTKLLVQGFGFQQFKHDNGTIREEPLFIKFEDESGRIIGQPSQATILNGDEFIWYTPAASLGTKATMWVSWNHQQWQKIESTGKDYTYLYYDAPQVTSIEPHFGPVKVAGRKAVVYGKNFRCPHDDCSKLTVRFGDAETGTLTPATLLREDQIEVVVPNYPKPDVLSVDVSFNGVDFTNDHVTYGFFDPYLLNVQPRLISPKGTTQLTLSGFGFVDSSREEIKARLSVNGEEDLNCNSRQPCSYQATYVDKNTILAGTFPQNEVNHGSYNIATDPMTVDVSVYGDVFTDSKINVWYYKEPDFISISRSAVPRNLPQPLLIKTDFHWQNNDIDRFMKHAHFQCRFTIADEVTFTEARMEAQPLGSMYEGESAIPTHILCPSPKVNHFGKGRLDITVNGQDYAGNFDFEITDPVDLFRVAPQSGPREGNTKVKMIGSGFTSSKSDVYSKFGTINTEKLNKQQAMTFAWSDSDYLNSLFMTTSDLDHFKAKNHALDKGQSVQSIYVHTPEAPSHLKTLGGPVYVSVGENYDLNVTDSNGGSHTSANYIYSNSLVEFYYYKNPVVKKVEPTSGLTEGGTKVELSGAWFDYKLEYGVLPMCKFGDKIVRGIFVSTVRIVCNSPPNDNIYSAVPVKVSLNGVDWVDSGFTFSYYVQPDVYDMTPKSGHMSGGTDLYIFGDRFSNITQSEQVQCKFSYIGNNKQMPAKIIPAFYRNETTMMCASPSGFVGGDSVHVQLTFNGADFTAPNENLIFTFYNVFGSFPRSGPADSFSESILVKGAGFKPSSKVICHLNHTDVPAQEVSPGLIRCPMALPGKDPWATGNVKFGVSIDGSWTDFGNFYYYEQISLNDITPRIGPAEGEGIIYFYGAKFRDNFANVEIGCKIGDSIGSGQMVDSSTIKCTVEEMDLVNEGEAHNVYVALNSYSWVGGNNDAITFVPYGVNGVYPNSGPYNGFTDILITGKGFTEDIAERAKCRFGVDSNFAIVDAEVLDYNKLVCRSPADFVLPHSSDETISVPIGIGFLDEDFRPWTEDLHRFMFYVQPSISYADPDEVLIGRMKEIYVIADDDSKFFEPVPTQHEKNQLDQYGIVCSFEDFGTAMGMYVNETAIMCVSPRIPGTSDDYYRETVQVAVAMNGQDFNDMQSDAEVTFIGTGSNMKLWHLIIGILLVGLLILSILTCCSALFHNIEVKNKRSTGPNVIALRDSAGSLPRGFNAYGYDIGGSASRASFGRPGSSGWRGSAAGR